LEEIDPKAWDFYSDWHKDMYGYRPRTIWGGRKPSSFYFVFFLFCFQIFILFSEKNNF
jgi:hypothetical protein